MKRLLLAFALVVSLPFTARADECLSLCQSGAGECRKECNGDAECLKQCDDEIKLCPKMCKAMQKAGGNPAVLQKEMEKIMAEQEAAEEKKKQQAEDAVARKQARMPKPEKDAHSAHGQ